MFTLLRRRANVSPMLLVMSVFEICLWIAVTAQVTGANAHDSGMHDVQHNEPVDSMEKLQVPAHAVLDAHIACVESCSTEAKLSKHTTGTRKPVHTGLQLTESQEKDGSPTQTPKEGSDSSASEQNWSLWSVFWMVVAAVGAVLATPSLRNSLDFTSKLSAAASGDGQKRYDSIDNYNKLMGGGNVVNADANKQGVEAEDEIENRNANYADVVNSYYDLATEFYEWGWGTSFHFADRREGENFRASILRHETYLAGRLGVNNGAKLLDCGCGVGGPARNISAFTGAHVTGITINNFQVQRGNTLSREQGASDRVNLVQGDFMKLPFPDNSFDGVYAIDATCHAPDRVGVYSEIFRVLKPGGVFATYEWCLTDKYDKENAEHRWIKKAIEEGGGLPDMCHTSVCTAAVESCGFDLVEARDCALDGGFADPWYRPLTPTWKPWVLPGFQFNPVVSKIFPYLLQALVFIRVVPKGTSKTQVMLQAGGVGCERGGATGVFTPMWLMVGRKPMTSK